MRLIVVRHGETIENKNGIHQGHTDGTLSKLGVEQAKKLALRLKDEKFDVVYSSDLGRTVNTAKEIMKYHPELKLNLDKRLRERHISQIAGKKFPENFDWENLPEGSEYWEDVQTRLKEFLDEIYSKHKNDEVLLVTHGGIKLVLIAMLKNKPLLATVKYSVVDNASVSVFEIEKDGDHKIHLLNCTKHLEN